MRCGTPLILTLTMLAGCQHQTPQAATNCSTPAPAQPSRFESIKLADEALSPDWRELAPGVQVNMVAKRIRIAAEICLDQSRGEPDRGVPLEAILVTPVSGKEHEAIAVTRARPSDIHAACLLLGLTPGKPGHWTFDAATRRLISHPPSGTLVQATIHLPAGSRPLADLVAVLDEQDRAMQPFVAQGQPVPSTWMFAGSFFGKFQGREVYDADYTGIVLGLCTFGGEVLAWPDLLDPESSRQLPIWYGHRELIPAFGTPVTIELLPVQ